MRRSSAPNVSSRAGASAATNHQTALAIVALLWGMAPVATQATVASQTPLPSPTSAEFASRIRQRCASTISCRRTTPSCSAAATSESKLGKVTHLTGAHVPVMPSPVSGQTYKRLMAVDDKPLAADELARDDAEHANDIKEAQALQARETPSQRAERQERSTREQRERDAILEDAFRAYDARDRAA